MTAPVVPPRPKTPRVPTAEELIVSHIRQALENSGYEQLRKIQAYYHHGRVVLQGRVTTYYLKQVAQESIRVIPEVNEIDNDLQVLCHH